MLTHESKMPVLVPELRPMLNCLLCNNQVRNTNSVYAGI